MVLLGMVDYHCGRARNDDAMTPEKVLVLQFAPD